MKLIPFIKCVVICLLVVCMATFIAGVARIHMFILSCLSAGLLCSLVFFENALNRAKVNSRAKLAKDDGGGEVKKTD